MQRKQDGLGPIGDAVSGLDDVLVSTLRETSPQAVHHFTLSDQVNQLGFGQRSGPRSGLHDAIDVAVQPTPHQPRQPPPVPVAI